jgi:hypothetical protein
MTTQQYPDIVFPGAWYSGDKTETAAEFEESLSAYLQEYAHGYYSRIVAIGKVASPFARKCNIFVVLEDPQEHMDLAKRINGQFRFKGSQLACRLSNSTPAKERNLNHMAWHENKTKKTDLDRPLIKQQMDKVIAVHSDNEWQEVDQTQKTM